MDQHLWTKVQSLGGRLAETELVRLPHPRVALYAKMESANPGGSVKDRAAYWILREAVRRGEITRRTTVVESSSGNFALALALFCGWLGITFIPVLDPNVNKATEAKLRHLCERVEKVEEPEGAGGFLRSRLRRVAELTEEIGCTYWPDQYANPDGARGHFEMTGRELVESLEKIDHLFVGVGTGATIAGLSQRVTAASPHTRVVAVDVEGSVIFGGPPGPRFIPGIGSAIRPRLVEHAVITDVVTVSEWDEVAGCRELLRKHAVYAGGSTGCVYAAINRYFEHYRGPPPTVAFLCADGGGPYRHTVYDPDWVATHISSPGPLPAAPEVELSLPR
ncbi:2,3-diaminopropionate biosynthesis protein SbnA [Streptomyces sp. SID12488]|uniref:2,3-diaminopropionate biosynthesis protein SbnA n=1 Tax=Streptomyces sp. SID12488 TaxID=2706040 RepID=UPI0013DA446E|nr:2,3-diaminopropionate biosynthesis protein SbnA [Streptomyces sp. SID12488]